MTFLFHGLLTIQGLDLTFSKMGKINSLPIVNWE